MTSSEWPPSGPVMGYNTWYQFRTGITEAEVVRQAQLLVSSGLAAAGYNCVNLDDGWMAAQRAANGELTWDAAKFPRGLPWLAGQIHALGQEQSLAYDRFSWFCHEQAMTQLHTETSYIDLRLRDPVLLRIWGDFGYSTSRQQFFGYTFVYP